MKIKISFLAPIALSFLFLSCEDILEEDITNATVVPIYPGQDSEVLGETVHFQWGAIEGADDYHIQVYKNTAGIILDSLISSNDFLHNLNPGEYTWRVRAENFAYYSAYNFPIDFSVQGSDDLTEQGIILNSPSNQIYTNDKDIVYSWQGLNAAASYEFEMEKNLNGSLNIVYTNTTTETNHSVPETIYDEDAEYIWRVKGVNDTSETDFSEHSVFIDTTEPPVPSLELPVDTSNSNSSSVDFSWNMGSDTGNVQSTRNAVIQIATDTGFTDIVEVETTSNENISLSFNEAGTFYWRVKITDMAGNESDYSNPWSFTIN